MIFEKTVLNIYKRTLLTRHDPDGSVFYFTAESFPGLICEEYSFLGDKGQRLAAYLYYKGKKRTDRLIMFDHGMGNGHAAYLREIDLITDRDYTVFTYDHTGTRCSEGEHIGGFSQSLSDLDRAVGFVRTLDGYADAKISVIGHSWGGFSTMNIPALHPKITHAVALAGFISPKAIQEQVLSGFLKFYRKAVLKLEHDAFPDYADFDGCETLKSTKSKVMIIHSKDDPTCRFENHFEKLKSAASDNPNVTLLALNGKRHNPTYTTEAVRLLAEFSQELRRKNKKKELSDDEAKRAFVSSFDWVKMTDQDKDVWNKIFEFLEK